MKIIETALVIFLCSDITACVILARQCWTLSNGAQTKLVRALTVLFCVMAARTFAELVLMFYGMLPGPVGFIFAIGRIALTMILWRLVFLLFKKPAIPRHL